MAASDPHPLLDRLVALTVRLRARLDAGAVDDAPLLHSCAASADVLLAAGGEHAVRGLALAQPLRLLWCARCDGWAVSVAAAVFCTLARADLTSHRTDAVLEVAPLSFRQACVLSALGLRLVQALEAPLDEAERRALFLDLLAEADALAAPDGSEPDPLDASVVSDLCARAVAQALATGRDEAYAWLRLDRPAVDLDESDPAGSATRGSLAALHPSADPLVGAVLALLDEIADA